MIPALQNSQSSTDRRLIGWALSLVLLVVLPVACTNGDNSDPIDAQPAPGVSTFKPGGFDDLPRYRGSTEAGSRSEDGGVISQSFFAEGTDPQLIIDFYRSELQGWDFSGERDVGNGLTAEFTETGEDGRRLEVSATRSAEDATGVDAAVQYSLVLHT